MNKKEKVSESAYLKQDDNICFGRVMIKDTNVPMWTVAERAFNAGECLHCIAYDFGIDEKLLSDALEEWKILGFTEND